jgi:ribonuclease PH
VWIAAGRAWVRYQKNAIEDDGEVVATALTAAGLALADASVYMFDIVVGSKVSLTRKKVVVDQNRNKQ